jgi:hypothetical protein
VDGDAQVKGLQAASAHIAIGKGGTRTVEDALYIADGLPHHQRARIVQRLADASPPGTSPTPVLPALSVRMTILRVKYGPCAPDRFSSMLSCPATGMTRMSVTRRALVLGGQRGKGGGGSWFWIMARFLRDKNDQAAIW